MNIIIQSWATRYLILYHYALHEVAILCFQAYLPIHLRDLHEQEQTEFHPEQNVLISKPYSMFISTLCTQIFRVSPPTAIWQ